MITFLVRRLVLGFFTIWVISIISFAVIVVPPGDFATQYADRLGQVEGGVAIGTATYNRMVEDLRPRFVQLMLVALALIDCPPPKRWGRAPKPWPPISRMANSASWRSPWRLPLDPSCCCSMNQRRAWGRKIRKTW